jgi:primosomal protein N''
MFNWFRRANRIDFSKVEDQWEKVVALLEYRVSVLEKEVKDLTEREVVNLIALAVLEQRLKGCVEKDKRIE